MVGIEEAHDLMKSFSAMVVPEYFCVDSGVTVAKICGELNFGVLRVIDTDKASDKSNDDHVPVGGGNYGRGDFMKRHLLGMRDVRCHKNHHGDDENKRRELPMPMISNASSPGPS